MVEEERRCIVSRRRRGRKAALRTDFILRWNETVADAVEQPQTLARNMMVDVNLLTGETVRMPGNPIKLSETNAETYSPPPRLGADTDEVLTTLLGKNEAQLSRLRELGAI